MRQRRVRQKAQTRSCVLCESTDLLESLKNAVDLVLGTQIIMIPCRVPSAMLTITNPGSKFS